MGGVWTNHRAAASQSQSRWCLFHIPQQSSSLHLLTVNTSSYAVSAIVSRTGGEVLLDMMGRSQQDCHTWWKKSVGGVFSAPLQRSTILTASDTIHTEEVRVTRNSRSGRGRGVGSKGGPGGSAGRRTWRGAGSGGRKRSLQMNKGHVFLSKGN